MTDETVLDGKQDEPGGKGSQPQPSAQNAQPSADVTALQKEVAELKKLYNGIKKSEDTINTRVEQRVSESISRIERIAELAKSGKSPVEIENQILLDEVLQERKSGVRPAPSEGTEKGGQGSVDVQDIARQLNLDVNDKDIASAVASGNLVGLMRVAMSKATAPSPNPEDNPPLTGGGAQQKSAEALTQEYIQKMRAAPRGPKGDAERRQIKNAYIKLGVNVGTVDFT